jgi:protein-disulfide isomerase/uncharacterized membrane protein
MSWNRDVELPGDPDDAPVIDDVPVRETVGAEPPEAAPRPRLGRTRALAAGLLCLVNAAIAGVLLLQHHGLDRAVAAVDQVCGTPGSTAPSGCDLVNRSAYAQVRGVPLAGAGLVVYGSLAALLLLGFLASDEPRTAGGLVAFAVLSVALVVDVFLLFLQVVVIRAHCRLCLLTYLLGLLALVLVLPARRALGALLRGLAGDGRLVVAGWAMATVALVAGVAAAEKGLDWRERAAGASILGGGARSELPAPGPGVASNPEAQRYQEEAAAAVEQARRLQEILDDPEKLERYFTEKAAREYEQGPVHALKLEGAPAKGPAEAPVKVVEYSDFLCPFCRNIAGAFDAFLPKSQGRVAILYKNYPLESECNPHVKPTVHAGACQLALGGICAQEQGRFWPYHDRVFANPPATPGVEDVARIAGEAGLDAGAMRACLASGKARDRLAAEIAEAHTAGVSATPTLFLNGRRLPRVNDFLAMVDRESGRLGLPPLPKQ